jgi:hypothetical protein
LPPPPPPLSSRAIVFGARVLVVQGQDTCMKRGLNQNLSVNEVHYTNLEMLLLQDMLCSRLHCQKGFN